MAAFVDLTDRTFGRLKVSAIYGKDKRGRALWLCKCECGREKVAQGYMLTSGDVKSCGCLGRGIGNYRHGFNRTRVYRIWSHMITRCFNPKSNRWPNYGGRGITVCDGWKKFENFLSDMGEPPTGMSIERIDNDGHYGPDNCKWSSRIEQSRNKRNNRLIEYHGLAMTAPEWSELTGINVGTIKSRLRSGWNIEKALSTGAKEVFFLDDKPATEEAKTA